MFFHVADPRRAFDQHALWPPVPVSIRGGVLASPPPWALTRDQPRTMVITVPNLPSTAHLPGNLHSQCVPEGPPRATS